MNTASNNENQQAHGAELRRAREQAGMTLEQASSDSRMPVRVLVALEAGEWTKLGAPVFVRGQLRSYAKLLGINADAFLADAEIAPVRPAELVSHDHTPRGERFFNQLGSKVVYAVMTAALAIPVYMVATRSPVPAQQQAEASQQAGRGTELMPPPREPVAASMASLPKPVATQPALRFEFDGESWAQFYAPDGSTLEKGLMKPGDRKDFNAGQLGRVVMGNASQVRVLRAGQPLDISQWLRSDVARFAVSSDGSPVASAE